MKKLSITFFLILSLLLTVCSPASADTITAMASEINPEHLEKVASYARILGYNEDENILTVELIVPEVFRRDEILALQVGDGIYTGGQEILIRSIGRYDGDSLIVINEGAYEFAEGSVYLYEDLSGNYRPEVYEDYTWGTLARLTCPVQESLLFLDGIDPKTGDPRTLPTVHTAQELTLQLLEAQTADGYVIGLDNNNVYVVFDGEGGLAVIQRFFVPWQ